MGKNALENISDMNVSGGAQSGAKKASFTFSDRLSAAAALDCFWRWWTFCLTSVNPAGWTWVRARYMS